VLWTQSYIYTLKEAPQDAEIVSHKLLTRAGFIKKVAPGIYTLAPLAVRAIRNIEAIVREELTAIGYDEVFMPMVQPAELWQETNRWSEMGDLLLKFKNRNGHSFCLGGTHEEVITDLIRKDIQSYRNLPVHLFQIQTKYRDEIRPRFGLMRGREFIMKDAYSFHADEKGAIGAYEKMYGAYQKIFDRLGLEYRIVSADAGSIGGSRTHEFQLLADAGEDQIMVSDQVDFAANVEIAPLLRSHREGAIGEDVINSEAKSWLSENANKKPEKFSTPGLRTIEELARSLNLMPKDLIKTLFVKGPSEKFACILLRGDHELNLIKLKSQLNWQEDPQLATAEEVKALSGALPGSCGPVGLNISVYADYSVEPMNDYVVGANEDDYHLKSVSHLRGDFAVAEFLDLRNAVDGDICPSGGSYKSLRGIEVGHVFYLGTKYSKAMNAVFLSKEGQSHPLEMGCYGIGVTRTLQASVEQNFDADGILWPFPVAPYKLHVCLLDPSDEELRRWTLESVSKIEAQGFTVLVDDRDERPGVKFKDADLIGMPLRLTVGKKGFTNGEVELVDRVTKTKTILKIDEAVESVLGELEDLKQNPRRGRTKRV